MPIKVTREPDSGPGLEPCFNCFRPTKYWYTKKDVACCQECAQKVRVKDVPSKRQWCEQVRQRREVRFQNTQGDVRAFWKNRRQASEQMRGLRKYTRRRIIEGAPYIREDQVHNLMLQAFERGQQSN